MWTLPLKSFYHRLCQSCNGIWILIFCILERSLILIICTLQRSLILAISIVMFFLWNPSIVSCVNPAGSLDFDILYSGKKLDFDYLYSSKKFDFGDFYCDVLPLNSFDCRRCQFIKVTTMTMITSKPFLFWILFLEKKNFQSLEMGLHELTQWLWHAIKSSSEKSQI